MGGDLDGLVMDTVVKRMSGKDLVGRLLCDAEMLYGRGVNFGMATRDDDDDDEEEEGK